MKNISVPGSRCGVYLIYNLLVLHYKIGCTALKDYCSIQLGFWERKKIIPLNLTIYETSVDQDKTVGRLQKQEVHRHPGLARKWCLTEDEGCCKTPWPKC